MEFNYWLLALSEGPPYQGYFNRYSSHSAAMGDARQVKFQEPSWRVVVEVIPSDQDHPEIDHWPDEFQHLRRSGPGRLGGDRG